MASEHPNSRPKLRSIEPLPVEHEGRTLIGLRDPTGLSDALVAVSPETFPILLLFDGEHTLRDVQADFMRQRGQLLYTDQLERLVQTLDQAGFLENQRFEALARDLIARFEAEPVRRAAHAGASYDQNPARLREQLLACFDPPAGPGCPDPPTPSSAPVRALIAPHIDLRLGGPCYAWGYRALQDAGPADLYVILGTAHAGLEAGFAATRKGFETPLGVAQTDQAFLDRLARGLGWDLEAEALAHRTDHTIEFQVVFLQLLFGASVPIVPILCGFPPTMTAAGRHEAEAARVRAFAASLRETIEAAARRVCVIASADLAHVGPRYGDPGPPDPAALRAIEAADRRTLAAAEAADAEGFADSILSDYESRRVCGFAPIYTLLKALPDLKGRTVRHDRAVTDHLGSTVTFASVVYE